MSMDDLSRAVIGVIGAGTMGAGIAQLAAQAGHEVRLFDAAEGAAANGKAAIGHIFGRLMEKGRMSPAERDETLARVIVCDDIKQLAGAGLVVEAIVEDLAVKRELFRRLEGVCSPETLLASNTSSLSITAIAANLAHQ
ncbi:MAG TPA: 3-hydroxyacyl-CoA dehydrogenase, partial [Rhodobacteraceae bacterium]|nr:3-hydroxyacyl-CoA dehydrogenase [Paracoccaceae bacterium]